MFVLPFYNKRMYKIATSVKYYQSARMSKITHDDLTRVAILATPTWQQWVSKG